MAGRFPLGLTYGFATHFPRVSRGQADLRGWLNYFVEAVDIGWAKSCGWGWFVEGFGKAGGASVAGAALTYDRWN
jgi:hypothetical protein